MRLLLKRLIVCLLAISFASMQLTPAYAGMVGTQMLIDHAAAKIDRDRLRGTLEREQVRNLLAKHGVTSEQAQERIDALTDQEVNQLAAHFSDEPAGGFIVETVLVAAVIVLILELVGITDIFPQF